MEHYWQKYYNYVIVLLFIYNRKTIVQTFLNFFGKFPLLVIATLVVIIITNFVFRVFVRMGGENPSFELNGLAPFIWAVVIGVIFFLVSMFYGPFSFIAFK